MAYVPRARKWKDLLPVDRPHPSEWVRGGRVHLLKHSIGAFMRAKRYLIGMFQNEFADLLPVAPHRLCIWETGRARPSGDWYIIHDMIWLRFFLAKIERDRTGLLEELARQQRIATLYKTRLEAAKPMDIRAQEKEFRSIITRRQWRVLRSLRKQIKEYEQMLSRRAKEHIQKTIWGEFAAWWRERAIGRAPDVGDVMKWLRESQPGYLHLGKKLLKAFGHEAHALGVFLPPIKAAGRGRLKANKITTAQSRAWEDEAGRLGFDKRKAENDRRIEEIRRQERERFFEANREG